MGIKNRMSVATIDSPEFVNIEKMSNPLISKCEIKVLYVGENRNKSYISKEVAREMAQTLPGAPIVGYYLQSKEDFGDHGDQMIIDGEGVKFNKLTKPYGFVAPDSKVWFQNFEDTDEFGNTVTREYLMTEGYLWTGQFEEAKRVVECGNPQSMELDEKTLKGYWSTDSNSGIDFFIINDAIFSKLCILGEDVEPCFEGASVTAPNVSSNFSKDDDFTKSLFTMMAELKYALNNDKGGLSMAELETPAVEEEVTAEVETSAAEEPVENFSNEQVETVETVESEIENSTEEFAKKNEPSEESKEDEECPVEEEKSEAEEESESEEKEDTDEEKKKYELLQSEYSELQNKFALLESENKELKAFKEAVEDKQKDEMIASFYMLSDEDKKDVLANKAQYTLDEIKAKLSIICVDKRVDFTLGEKETQSAVVETPIVTYNLDSHEQSDIPAWLRTVDSIHNRNK